MGKGSGVLGLLILVLVSCNKDKENNGDLQNYVIEEGQHQSNHSFEHFTDSILEFKVIFDSTAKYSNIATKNQDDINKLFGMSDCGLAHHYNSARIGWKWKNNKIQLHSYCYVNGKKTEQFIDSVSIDTEIQCTIICKKNHYYFEVNNKHFNVIRTCTGNDHYLLYPYFGGDETAPHKIKIKLAYKTKN